METPSIGRALPWWAIRSREIPVLSKEVQIALSGTLNDEGYSALREGRYDVALALLHRAGRISADLGDREGAILALQNQFLLHSACGRAAEGLGCFIDALATMAEDRRVGDFEHHSLLLLGAFTSTGLVRMDGWAEIESALRAEGPASKQAGAGPLKTLEVLLSVVSKIPRQTAEAFLARLIRLMGSGNKEG